MTASPNAPEPDGFTLAEMLAATLVIALVVASLFTITRTAQTVMNRAKATSTQIQAMDRLVLQIATTVGQVQGSDMIVRPCQIVLGGALRLDLIPERTRAPSGTGQQVEPGACGTLVVVRKPDRRRWRETARFSTGRYPLRFEEVRSARGTRAILVRSTGTGPGQQGRTRVIPVWVDSPTPCMFDSATSNCRGNP